MMDYSYWMERIKKYPIEAAILADMLEEKDSNDIRGFILRKYANNEDIIIGKSPFIIPEQFRYPYIYNQLCPLEKGFRGNIDIDRFLPIYTDRYSTFIPKESYYYQDLMRQSMSGHPLCSAIVTRAIFPTNIISCHRMLVALDAKKRLKVYPVWVIV